MHRHAHSTFIHAFVTISLGGAQQTAVFPVPVRSDEKESIMTCARPNLLTIYAAHSQNRRALQIRERDVSEVEFDHCWRPSE
jgi:hypothetical protein